MTVGSSAISLPALLVVGSKDGSCREVRWERSGAHPGGLVLEVRYLLGSFGASALSGFDERSWS